MRYRYAVWFPKVKNLWDAKEKNWGNRIRPVKAAMTYISILAAKLDAAIYVCYADSVDSDFRGALTNAGWLLKQCLI